MLQYFWDMFQPLRWNVCFVLEYCFECCTVLSQWLLVYKYEPLHTTCTSSNLCSVNFPQYINHECWVKSLHFQNMFMVSNEVYAWASHISCTISVSLLFSLTHSTFMMNAGYKQKPFTFRALSVLFYSYQSSTVHSQQLFGYRHEPYTVNINTWVLYYRLVSPKYIPNECWILNMRLPYYMDQEW